MSAWTDRHKNNTRLLLDPHVKTIKARLPKYGDAFEKRINELLDHAAASIDKLDAIRSSGRYSPDGERTERSLAARSFSEHAAKVRAETSAKLEQQISEQRAALVKPRATKEPLEALLREMRQRELRDHWRALDPLTIQTRIKQTDDSELLDALDAAPVGFAIAPPEMIAEARIRLAEENHPELGELAQLKAAYDYAINSVEQVVIEATGLSKREVAGAAT